MTGKMKWKCLMTASLLSYNVLPSFSWAYDASNPWRTDLIADGGSDATKVDIGDVLVWNDSEDIYVRYLIINPADPRENWCISKTHLAAATTLAGLPKNSSGNPVIGKFPYKTTHEPCVTDFTYTIPLNSWVPGTELFLASHADARTQYVGLGGLQALLPDTVTIRVTYPIAGGQSYFPTLTVSNDGFLNGVYNGWCVDTDHTIPQNTSLTASVYSSYESIPAGLIEYPQNLDLVNWLLNQNYVGTYSPGGYGIYTYGDIQRAIWTLVDDTNSTSGLGAYSQYRVNEIVNAALLSGEGFVPGCNEQFAILFDPHTSSGSQQQVVIGQTTLATLGIACETRSETAWGWGSQFPGSSWAQYFNFTVE